MTLFHFGHEEHTDQKEQHLAVLHAAKLYKASELSDSVGGQRDREEIL